MIKVIDKTFAILESAVIASPEPVRVSELAARHNLNMATCSRILRQLTTAGYLIQVSRQSGYTAGPRALAFANQVVYQERLLAAARPVIDEVSHREHASVLLCERRHFERYILYHVNGCEQLDIRLTELSWHDLFVTASGLVLCAIATGEEQPNLLDYYHQKEELPLPPEQMKLQLDEIRTAGGYRAVRGNQGIAACVITRNHLPVAVLGGSLPTPEYRRRGGEVWLNTLRQAAAKISQRISYVNHAG